MSHSHRPSAEWGLGFLSKTLIVSFIFDILSLKCIC